MRRLKGVKDGRDITQADLAKATGVSATSVSEWEADKKAPREGALIKLAKFLGVSPAYLRYGVTESRPPVQKGPDEPSAKERAEFVNHEMEAARKERERAEAAKAASGTRGPTRRR